MDFRHAYHEHQREVRAQLKRATGRVRISIGEVDPRRMTERQLDDLALRDAECVVNIAIHQHNEEVARSGYREQT